MNVVFLSPHFPPNMWLFSLRLKEQGATVLGIGDVRHEDLRPELRGALADYAQVPDLHDDDALVRAMGGFIARHGRLDHLDSLNEHWLETEARLRVDFNIPGLRPPEVDRIRRKSVMKEVFEEAGVPVARGCLVRSAKQVRKFARKVGLPIVAKPDIGVGGDRARVIEDEAQLETYLAEGTWPTDILEDRLEGDIVTYDGLADRDGRIVLDWSLHYGSGVLDAVRHGADMHYWVEREVPDDLRELGGRICAAFGIRRRPFHIEFFRRPDGRLVAMEINVRQPGGPSVDMVDFANDVDVYRAWAEVVVHGTSEPRPTRRSACLWAGRKRDRAYRLSHGQVMQRFADLIFHHERVADVFAAAIGNEGYLLRGPDIGLLREAAAEIQALAPTAPPEPEPMATAEREPETEPELLTTAEPEPPATLELAPVDLGQADDPPPARRPRARRRTSGGTGTGEPEPGP